MEGEIVRYEVLYIGDRGEVRLGVVDGAVFDAKRELAGVLHRTESGSRSEH